MKRRDLFKILIMELLAIVVAGASFALIPSKLVAGFVAGAYFVGFAVVSLAHVRRWSRPWRSATVYPLLVHLFVVSIPLLVTRARHADQGFVDLRVLGLSGPEFHRLSTTVFTILIVATVIDLGRTWLSKRR